MNKIVGSLKSLVKAAMGREILVKPDLACAMERFGSNYGGWDIVAADMQAGSIVYSFGVGEDASFDLALTERFGLTVHAFDPTPKSIEWVKGQGFSDRFVLHKYGLAAVDGMVSFNPPENPDHVSHTILDKPATRDSAISVPVKRLVTIMKELEHASIDILKMDIEGAEYDVIDDIRETEIRPRQMLVEFHHRFPGVGVRKTEQAIDTLRAMGYRLFSVSTSKEEFSFIYHAVS